MSRRLIPVKSLSVMILAPRRHDRQLWADLLKNCGIEHPLCMSDIEHATSIVSAGQADIVFVDESYGPQHIAKMLVPARQVEFAGGRGVCLILCAKKATAQDVINARKLGIASLVILPTSIDTVRKHLELAARYIPQTDEELGWAKPKEKTPSPTIKSDARPPEDEATAEALSESFSKQRGARRNGASGGHDARANQPVANPKSVDQTSATQALTKENSTNNAQGSSALVTVRENGSTIDHPSGFSENRSGSEPSAMNEESSTARPKQSAPSLLNDLDVDIPTLTAPGRSGRSADEDVVFL